MVEKAGENAVAETTYSAAVGDIFGNAADVSRLDAPSYAALLQGQFRPVGQPRSVWRSDTMIPTVRPFSVSPFSQHNHRPRCAVEAKDRTFHRSVRSTQWGEAVLFCMSSGISKRRNASICHCGEP